MLEFEGKELVTSVAIGRYLAQTYGLYPANADDIYNTESVMDLLTDLMNVYVTYFKAKDLQEGWENYSKNEIIPKLKVIEGRLRQNHGGSGFFIGTTPTLLDISVAAFIQGHYFLEGQQSRLEVLQREAPLLKTFIDRFTAIPEIANYLRTRPVSLA